MLDALDEGNNRVAQRERATFCSVIGTIWWPEQQLEWRERVGGSPREPVFSFLSFFLFFAPFLPAATLPPHTLPIPMGLLWSKPSGTDYEKILTDLTARIAEVEGRVKKTRRQHRSVSLWCLSYGSLLYLLYGLWVFLYPRGPASVPYRPLLDALGLIGGPLLIYQTHRLLGWLYARRIAYYDARLREYRGQQKLKVRFIRGPARHGLASSSDGVVGGGAEADDGVLQDQGLD